MKPMKCAVLTGIATMALAAGAPANATWGWGSSGWGSSGWGSSGWGSSGSSGSSGGSTSSSGGSTGSSGGTPVPEPSSMMMLGLGLGGLVAGRVAAKRRKKMSDRD